MCTDNIAESLITQQLKEKGCNDEQIQQATHKVKAFLKANISPSHDEKNVKESPINQQLEEVRQTAKAFSDALTKLFSDFCEELNYRIEENINSPVPNFTDLSHEEQLEYCYKYAHVNNGIILKILKQYIEVSSLLKQELNENNADEHMEKVPYEKQAVQSTYEAAYLWVDFAEKFGLPISQKDAIDFCCNIFSTNKEMVSEETIKTRFKKYNIRIMGKQHGECERLVFKLRFKLSALSEIEKQHAIEKISSQTALTKTKVIELMSFDKIKFPRNLTTFQQALTDAITIIDKITGPKQLIKISRSPHKAH